VELKHDYASILCQTQIFLAFLAAVMLKADPTGDNEATQALGSILMAICALPPVGILVLQSPGGKYILDHDKRDMVRAKLAHVRRKVTTWFEVRYAKLTRRYYKPEGPASARPIKPAAPAVHFFLFARCTRAVELCVASVGRCCRAMRRICRPYLLWCLVGKKYRDERVLPSTAQGELGEQGPLERALTSEPTPSPPPSAPISRPRSAEGSQPPFPPISAWT